MSIRQSIELPLFEVFETLRRLEDGMEHRGVDTASFLLLIDMLRKGYFLLDREQLYFLCEKLWIKPFHNNRTPVNAVVLRKLLDEALAGYEVVADRETSASETDVTDTQTVDDQVHDYETKYSSANEPPTTATPIQEPYIDEEPQGEETTLRLSIANQPAAPVARATDLDEETENLLLARSYIVKGNYYPISPRRIEQTIRSYRYKGGKQTSPAIDVESTLKRIARMGYFDHYVRKKEDVYTTDWTLLIDHEGSMVAFHPLCDAIAKMTTRQGVGDRNNVYYFKNFPVTYLYQDRAHRQAEKFNVFAAGPRRNILVLSDAGAARGNFNETRIEATRKMLRQLGRHKIAWLNPMPRRRWWDTSAEKIAGYVDMFELGDGNTDDLANIVRVFKTKINSKQP